MEIFHRPIHKIQKNILKGGFMLPGFSKGLDKNNTAYLLGQLHISFHNLPKKILTRVLAF
jgi:hypothetical protein